MTEYSMKGDDIIQSRPSPRQESQPPLVGEARRQLPRGRNTSPAGPQLNQSRSNPNGERKSSHCLSEASGYDADREYGRTHRPGYARGRSRARRRSNCPDDGELEGISHRIKELLRDPSPEPMLQDPSPEPMPRDPSPERLPEAPMPP
jgi:hypothetical protein